MIRSENKQPSSVVCRPSSVVRYPSSVVRRLINERMNAEQPVRPHLERRPAAAAGQRLERVDGVFVAVLGMDGLAGAEIDRRAVEAHLLPSCRGEVHFDSVVRAVVEGVMLEGPEIEVGAE